ncbi:hypothetical protein T484DRAFT_1847926, partial [Baffinella frigidus]
MEERPAATQGRTSSTAEVDDIMAMWRESLTLLRTQLSEREAEDLQAMKSFAQTMEERARTAENLVRELQASLNTMHTTGSQPQQSQTASQNSGGGGGAGGVQAELLARQVEALEAALQQAHPLPPPPTELHASKMTSDAEECSAE